MYKSGRFQEKNYFWPAYEDETMGHHHQSGCVSVPNENPPPNAFHNSLSFETWLQVDSSYIFDQVIAPSWWTSRSFMSIGYLFCDSGCTFVVTSASHMFLSSVFVFSFIPGNVCHTTPFPHPVVTIYSLKVTATIYLSISYIVMYSFNSACNI